MERISYYENEKFIMTFGIFVILYLIVMSIVYGIFEHIWDSPSKAFIWSYGIVLAVPIYSLMILVLSPFLLLMIIGDRIGHMLPLHWNGKYISRNNERSNTTCY